MFRYTITIALFFAFFTPGRAAPAQVAGPITAIEKAVEDAIASSQESVVALARVRKDAHERDADLFDQHPGRFRLDEAPPITDPTSPNFVPQEYASAVAIDRQLVVTTYHVLGDIPKNEYYIWSDRQPYKAEVVAADPWIDLAVLKIDGDLTPIKLGDAKTLKKGQFVISLGNPYAIAKDGRASAKWGLVSNLRREAPLARPRKALGTAKDGKETLHHYGTLIETDAKLERGTSGGALINLEGEMIGLTTSYSPASDVEVPAGFCIPVDQSFKDAVDKLKTGRKLEFGVLGVVPLDQLPAPGKHGVVVAGVRAATPGASAGFLPKFEFPRNTDYDTITRIDDEEVEDFVHLIMLLSRMPAGKNVTVTVERWEAKTGKTRILQKQVSLFKKYIDTMRPAYATIADASWRGLSVDYITAIGFSLNSDDKAIDPDGCVVTTEIEPNSLAQKAGIGRRWFVSKVDNKRVATPAEFYKAVEKKTGPVRLEVKYSGGQWGEIVSESVTVPAS
jgi:serine protease Do